ncbi:uncharacterized protein LOC144106805 [Amblyomma americanum]
MEHPGAPLGDPRTPAAALEAPSSGFPQTHTEGGRRYDIGPFLSYYECCTATDVQGCRIIHHLSQWNTLLFPARFELQELAGTPGRLSLETFSFSGLELPDSSESESSQADRALHCLLTTHHCIASLHTPLPRSGSSEALLCNALRRNTSLKTLKLEFSEIEISNDLAVVIQCLTSLEEFECTVYTMCPANFLAALCTLLRTSTCLTSMRMHGSFLAEPQSNAILEALMANSTLREFSMDGSFALHSHGNAFSNYLQFLTALTTLRFAARNDKTQNLLLRGILRNRTLSSLTLTRFICNEESNGLVARIFRENEALLAFRIISTQVSLRRENHRNYDWVAALSENNTLQELTLPLSIWPPSSWANFFSVLTEMSNLKKVYIKDSFNFLLVSSVSRALEESGAEEKVSFGSYIVISNTNLLKCKAFSKIYLNSVAAEDVRLAALRQLPQCPHLTSLSVDISRGSLTMSSALAVCIKSSPHLRYLLLRAVWAADTEENSPNEWWKILAGSICIDASLKELVISANSVDKEGFDILADAVRHSRSIRTFHLMDETAANTGAFVTSLSNGIANNYTLQSVRLHSRLDAEATASWFAITETARRNCGILARAMQFCGGHRLDRYVAEALERVSLHAALMEDLADLCQTTKDSMVASVQAHLKSIEPINAFMKLTGVVSERVVCHRRDDEVMQLDDLNQYCWNRIRRYLMVEDIKISALKIADNTGGEM